MLWQFVTNQHFFLHKERETTNFIESVESFITLCLSLSTGIKQYNHRNNIEMTTNELCTCLRSFFPCGFEIITNFRWFFFLLCPIYVHCSCYLTFLRRLFDHF